MDHATWTNSLRFDNHKVKHFASYRHLNERFAL